MDKLVRQRTWLREREGERGEDERWARRAHENGVWACCGAGEERRSEAQEAMRQEGGRTILEGREVGRGNARHAEDRREDGWMDGCGEEGSVRGRWTCVEGFNGHEGRKGGLELEVW